MFTKTFTDPQGIEHTDAVFEVVDVTHRNNLTSQYTYTLPVPPTDDEALVVLQDPVLASQQNSNLRYRMYYWPNQAARDAGFLPYVLANVSPVGEWFEVNNLSEEFLALPLNEMAEKHCREVVLVS